MQNWPFVQVVNAKPPQEPRGAQVTPGEAQERPRRGSREGPGEPRKAQEGPKRSPTEALPGEARDMTREPREPRRGPGEAQDRPRTSPGKAKRTPREAQKRPRQDIEEHILMNELKNTKNSACAHARALQCAALSCNCLQHEFNARNQPAGVYMKIDHCLQRN